MKYGKMELGQVEALVNIIGGLEVVMRLLQGTAKVVIEIVKHVIDMDANPYIPDRWKVESHKKGGQLEWDLKKVQLYLPEHQQGGKCIEGKKLRKEMENQPVYNANLLDYLLAHPELISEDWEGKYIFFWVPFTAAPMVTCASGTCAGIAGPGAGTAAGSTVTSAPAVLPRSLASSLGSLQLESWVFFDPWNPCTLNRFVKTPSLYSYSGGVIYFQHYP